MKQALIETAGIKEDTSYKKIVQTAIGRILDEGITKPISRCMDTTYRQERSLNGIELDVLKSGIQKYCRRGVSEKAIWCAIELYSFRFCSDIRAKSIYTNFFHRVMIIYLEDVSAANRLDMWKKMDELLFTDSRSAATEFDDMINAVNILAQSTHSREPSHYSAVFHPAVYSDILCPFHPQVLYHIDLGRPEQIFELRGNEKALEKEVCFLLYCLENGFDDAVWWALRIRDRPEIKVNRHRKRHVEYIIFDILEEFMEANEYEDLIPYVAIAVRWFTEIKTKERSLCYIVLILAILRRDKLKNLSMQTIEKIDARSYFEKNLNGEKIEIDSFVIDMHTRRGKIAGADRIRFAHEGAVVKNEVLYRPQYKDFYIDSKILFEMGHEEYIKYKHESKFKLVARAQLTCSHARADTYFAVDPQTGDTVFVKGPYPSFEAASVPLKVRELKKKLGLSYTEVRMEYLIPDQFLEEPPAVGIRNKLDCTEPQAFLIFESLVGSEIPTKIVSSKTWPDTEVVNWRKCKKCKPLSGLDDLDDKELEADFILNMLFRIIVGIPDVAWRNFLISDTVGFVAVDEEAVDKVISLRQIGSSGYKLIDKAVKKKDTRNELKRWREVFKNLDEEHALKTIREILKLRSISSVVRT